MMRLVLLALLLPSLLGGAAASTGDKEKPPYWEDKRLEKVVRFPAPKRREPPLYQEDPNERLGSGVYRAVRLVDGSVVDVTALIEKLNQETQVPLAVQGDWGREAVILTAEARPARAWMDTLAEAFAGRWWKLGETWVLAINQETARLSTMTSVGRSAERYRMHGQLFKGIQPNQWRILAETGRLELGQMLPAQRQLLRTYLLSYYYDSSEPRANALGPDALQGKGVYLALTKSGKDARLEIIAPLAPGIDLGPWTAVLPFYNPETGELLWGVPPPR